MTTLLDHAAHWDALAEAVDYFVAKVLVTGAAKRKISELDGLRLDYVLGVVLASDVAFWEAFRANLYEAKLSDMGDSGDAFAVILDLDYCALVGK